MVDNETNTNQQAPADQPTAEINDGASSTAPPEIPPSLEPRIVQESLDPPSRPDPNVITFRK